MRIRSAISRIASLPIVVVVIILVSTGVFGIYLSQIVPESNTGSTSYSVTVLTTELPSPSISQTVNTLLTTSSSTCYSLALPRNETVTTKTNSMQTMIFNVTDYFDAGNWVSFLGSPIHFSSYTFVAYSPNSTTVGGTLFFRQSRSSSLTFRKAEAQAR